MAKYGTEKDKQEILEISRLLKEMSDSYAELAEFSDKEDTVDTQNQVDVLTMKILRLYKKIQELDA